MSPEEIEPKKLRAIHESDLAKVLGVDTATEWACHVCQRPNGGPPAAFLKTEEGLRPLCFECLMQAETLNG